MKMTRSIFITGLAAIGLAAPLAMGQTYYYTPGQNGAYYTAPPAPSYSPAAAPAYTADQLRQLLAPIALYPDPLLTQILAAATYPQDIAAAQQWLQYFPNPSEDNINAQPWDPSVKALVHYPSVLAMMANQQDWTAALGAAFAGQPQDVMNMVQQLRSEAQAANALVSTPQQQVVSDGGVIQILPAQPNVIYVPQYDPGVVYVQRPYYSSGPLITFGASYGIGGWLNLDWDWHAHHVNQGVRWDRGWQHRDDHVSEWRHNPARPIIVPHNFPDRNHPDNRGPGWNNGPDHRPAFDVHQTPRPDDHSHAPQRPVVGIPNHPAPPHPVEPPHPVQPPRPPAPPHPAPPAHPVEPPHVQTPPPNGNFVGPPNSPYNRRPVEGIPHASAPAAPIAHPAPAPAPIRSGPAAPAPAFHNEGGGASIQAGRGNASMHR